jgi:nicotinamide/nicotinate riboside kinase
MSDSLLIGIGGVSRSGKSSLALLLREHFKSNTVAIVNQDEYIHSAFQMPWVENELDWEDPESLDFQRMYYEIGWLEKNVEILIVEGLFAFYYPELNKRYDKKLMVEISYKCFYQRKQRDQRWGAIPDWYIKHIWDSYMKYGLPDQLDEVLVLNGEEEYELDPIVDYLIEREKP